MKSPSRINSPSIDIEAFFDGLSWDNETEVQTNLTALSSGVRLLHEAILDQLVYPQVLDFNALTRSLQNSDPLFQVCEILEGFLTTQSGEGSRFKEVASDLSLLREILAGLVKCAPDEAAGDVRRKAFEIYLELLPKIHSRFVGTKDVLLQWKAAVMLDQQVDFVSRVLDEHENIAEPAAVLAWGNDYLKAISSGETEGEEDRSDAREIAPVLAELNSRYLQLLKSETKREVETYEDTIVLTPATHEHALSGFSELIFRARKEAEEGATFGLTLDFEAVPMPKPVAERKGPALPSRPIHLKRAFQTTYVQLDEIRKLIDGMVAGLQEEVDNGDFKEQDAKSLTSWFTDSIVPWVQTDKVTLVEA